MRVTITFSSSLSNVWLLLEMLLVTILLQVLPASLRRTCCFSLQSLDNWPFLVFSVEIGDPTMLFPERPVHGLGSYTPLKDWPFFGFPAWLTTATSETPFSPLSFMSTSGWDDLRLVVLSLHSHSTVFMVLLHFMLSVDTDCLETFPNEFPSPLQIFLLAFRTPLLDNKKSCLSVKWLSRIENGKASTALFCEQAFDSPNPAHFSPKLWAVYFFQSSGNPNKKSSHTWKKRGKKKYYTTKTNMKTLDIWLIWRVLILMIDHEGRSSYTQLEFDFIE